MFATAASISVTTTTAAYRKCFFQHTEFNEIASGLRRKRITVSNNKCSILLACVVCCSSDCHSTICDHFKRSLNANMSFEVLSHRKEPVCLHLRGGGNFFSWRSVDAPPSYSAVVSTDSAWNDAKVGTAAVARLAFRLVSYMVKFTMRLLVRCLFLFARMVGSAAFAMHRSSRRAPVKDAGADFKTASAGNYHSDWFSGREQHATVGALARSGAGATSSPKHAAVLGSQRGPALQSHRHSSPPSDPDVTAAASEIASAAPAQPALDHGAGARQGASRGRARSE